MSRGIGKHVLIAGAAAFLAAQPAMASATVAKAGVDPLVTLSVFGTAQSRAAVCAGSVAATAAASAATVQGPAPNCVLPVTAPAAVAPVGEAVPPPVVPVAAGPGIGTLPLLLGLAAIIGIAALLLSSGGDGDGDITPISPD